MIQKLKIEGMSCNSCANRVAKTLKEVPGVADARVSLADGLAEVETSAAVDASVLTAAVEKKGYKATHVAEIFDKPDRLNPCEFEQWLKQVTESASQAKSYSWAIIHRRTKRNPILYMPWKMVEALKPLGVMNKPWKIFFTFHATIQMRTEVKFKGRPKKTLVRFERHRISGVRLDEWLERVTPRLLLRLHKKVAA